LAGRCPLGGGSAGGLGGAAGWLGGGAAGWLGGTGPLADALAGTLPERPADWSCQVWRPARMG
jgi:hypothetical protein